MAQAFNKHFSTVCSSLIPDPFPDCNLINTLPSHSSFSFNKITPLNVQHVINDLKVSSGPGLGGIESKFLKLSSHIIMYPLCYLFNLSLSTCDIPETWKCSRVIPLYKGPT